MTDKSKPDKSSKNKTDKPRRPHTIWQRIQDLPPSAFALPKENRQAKHLQRQRKALATCLARHGNPDGTNIFVSVEKIAKAMGYSRSSVFARQADLRTLGILQEGPLHPIYKTVIRRLVLPDPKDVPSSQDDPSNLRNDSENDLSSLHKSPVQSSRVPVQSSRVPVQSSQSPVHKEDWTLPDSYQHTYQENTKTPYQAPAAREFSSSPEQSNSGSDLTGTCTASGNEDSADIQSKRTPEAKPSEPPAGWPTAPEGTRWMPSADGWQLESLGGAE
jgi:hypothetical protein